MYINDFFITSFGWCPFKSQNSFRYHILDYRPSWAGEFTIPLRFAGIASFKRLASPLNCFLLSFF